MSSPLAVPPELVRDAIAQIDTDGHLHAVTDAMKAWIAQFADHMDQLPLSGDQRASLKNGEPAIVVTGDGHWELQQVVHGDGVWLVVRDIADQERHFAVQLELARCRSLAAAAGMLAHDLNNQFNAVLGLSAQLDVVTQDQADRLAVRELERGTKVGARMASSLARLLVRRGQSRELFEPASMLADALSMMRKALQQAGIDLHVEVAPDLPAVRAAHVDAVQMVMHGLSALQHAGPSAVRCALTCESFAVASGRERDCVVLRCHAAPLAAAATEQLLAVVQGQQGALAHIASNPDVLEGLANAVFVQKRLGGDLIVATAGDGLQLQFVWPAVRG